MHIATLLLFLPYFQLQYLGYILAVPDMVNIISAINSDQHNRINVQWDKPKDGGAAILFYKVSYQRVSALCIYRPLQELLFSVKFYVTSLGIVIKPLCPSVPFRSSASYQFD